MHFFSNDNIMVRLNCLKSPLSLVMTAIIIIITVVRTAAANRIDVTNNCPFTVWPGIHGNQGREHLNRGGFELIPNRTITIRTADDWEGSIWGRTKCNHEGTCETGDCGSIECNGVDGKSTASRAYIWFAISRKNSYYVSLGQGYNLPIKIVPTNGEGIDSMSRTNGDRFYCKETACVADVNTLCPDQLSVTIDGVRVACKNPCKYFDTDEHCCQGYHGNHKCKCNEWTTNYLKVLKSACPNAHTYDYDYRTSTFSCPPNPAVVYHVIFCP